MKYFSGSIVIFIAVVLVSCQASQISAVPASDKNIDRQSLDNKNTDNKPISTKNTDYKSFEQWCLNKDSLSLETRKTVELMLKVSGTKDCKLANSKLRSLSNLDLVVELDYSEGLLNAAFRADPLKISDLRPLASLTNLTTLNLTYNKISDLKPLANLTNLTTLILTFNEISDIKPLSRLTKLTMLQIGANKISDIKPLASLVNLTSLQIESNQVRDFKPLNSLTKLDILSISDNPSSLKSCPLKRNIKLCAY